MPRQQSTIPPTLEQMRQSAPWLWVHCTNQTCLRKAPMAITPHHPVGSRRVQRPAAAISTVYGLRTQGRDAAASELGGEGDRLGTVSEDPSTGNCAGIAHRQPGPWRLGSSREQVLLVEPFLHDRWGSSWRRTCRVGPNQIEREGLSRFAELNTGVGADAVREEV
jgi:hypothetical protein